MRLAGGGSYPRTSLATNAERSASFASRPMIGLGEELSTKIKSSGAYHTRDKTRPTQPVYVRSRKRT